MLKLLVTSLWTQKHGQNNHCVLQHRQTHVSRGGRLLCPFVKLYRLYKAFVKAHKWSSGRSHRRTRSSKTTTATRLHPTERHRQTDRRLLLHTSVTHFVAPPALATRETRVRITHTDMHISLLYFEKWCVLRCVLNVTKPPFVDIFKTTYKRIKSYSLQDKIAKVF